jgi:predicted Zn-dependent protease
MNTGLVRLVLGMLGVGAQVGILLPFSREHASEAEHISVIRMAAAGYDPAEAPHFWLRMESASKGGGPEFLSTHPRYGRRMQDQAQWAAEDARQLYDGSPHAPDADRPLPVPGQRRRPHTHSRRNRAKTSASPARTITAR